MTDAYIATSIARRLIVRMHATHERRRIAVFAGPPGIGKTTAIDALNREIPDGIVVVKVARRNAREVLVLQHVLDAIRRLAGSPSVHFPSSLWELRGDIFNAICCWAGAEPAAARRAEYSASDFPKLTIVFDEAQNLSREAIEALRYWNDTDRCYAPFPLGLVFVGNNEFSLQTDLDGRSVISAAVADRALYVQTFDYSDVIDDDIRLYLEAKGIVDESALSTMARHINERRTSRSFRRIQDLVEELTDASSGESVTVGAVRELLAIV
jgi:hypothetical protein